MSGAFRFGSDAGVSLSIGILVSSKANSQSEAIQLAFLTFLPNIFFSGYIFPRETMPKFFYIISYFVPASYYINITRGINPPRCRPLPVMD